MSPIFTISKYTFLEAIRDKFIWFVFTIMIAGIPLGIFMKELTLYGSETAMPTVVIAIITIAIVIVSVLYVNIATSRELEGKIMLVVLTKPISNLQYLLGKLFGFWLVAASYVLLGAVIIFVTKISSFLFIVKFTYALLLLQFIIISFSLFFSLLLNSLASGIIMSTMSWILFTSTQTLWELTKYSDSVIARIVGPLFYYIFPNYSRFDLKHLLLYGEHATGATSNILLMLPYTLIYLTIVMIFSWIDFSKKEY